MRELGVSSLIAACLVARGLVDPAAADKYLNPSLDQLHSPKLLPDYDLAAKAILGALERKETIYVHGDYDADGVTSAAIFTRFLESLKADVVPHVPHRQKEGYGIHMEAIGWAKEHGAKLFLTCDCGISAHEQLRAAIAAGMVPVVTDHHAQKSTLPEAEAIVNPHRVDSTYPFANLCGAGVALKLCAGLTADLGHNPARFYDKFLDLAAIGTVADVMPLVDENRVITALGLPRLAETQKLGLRELMKVARVGENGQKVNAGHIGFQIGPRLNAAGRIDDAAVSLDILLTKDEGEAKRLALLLDQLNIDRKQETERMLLEAMAIAESDGMANDHVIVLAREGWHSGIVGIVAGKIREALYRPAFILGSDGPNIWKGSARSIPTFHLADAISELQGMLISGGGHAQAAGITIARDQLDAFRAAINDYAKRSLDDEDLIPRKEADAELHWDELTEAAAYEMERLEPFGTGNPQPSFIMRGASVASMRTLSKPSQAMLTLAKDGKTKPAITWKLGEELAESRGEAMDWMVQPEINVYRGSSTFRLKVEDARPASS